MQDSTSDFSRHRPCHCELGCRLSDKLFVLPSAIDVRPPKTNSVKAWLEGHLPRETLQQSPGISLQGECDVPSRFVCSSTVHEANLRRQQLEFGSHRSGSTADSVGSFHWSLDMSKHHRGALPEPISVVYLHIMKSAESDEMSFLGKWQDPLSLVFTYCIASVQTDQHIWMVGGPSSRCARKHLTAGAAPLSIP